MIHKSLQNYEHETVFVIVKIKIILLTLTCVRTGWSSKAKIKLKKKIIRYAKAFRFYHPYSPNDFPINFICKVQMEECDLYPWLNGLQPFLGIFLIKFFHPPYLEEGRKNYFAAVPLSLCRSIGPPTVSVYFLRRGCTFKHWMPIFGCDWSYNTPSCPDKLKSAL